MGINVVQNYILTDCVWRISARWTVTQKSGLELAATNMSLAKQGGLWEKDDGGFNNLFLILSTNRMQQ